MRTIDYHKIPGADTALSIETTDEMGSGGAYHRYQITGLDLSKNPSMEEFDAEMFDQLVILFQNGPIPTNGYNGTTIEALLAICMDRLMCFQEGPFSSEDNDKALFHLTVAMSYLKTRTTARIARGVEGKEVK